MKFKKGDEIFLKKSSRWFNTHNNPKSESIYGIITDIKKQDKQDLTILPIQVRWIPKGVCPQTNNINTYNEEDLELVVKIKGWFSKKLYGSNK